MVWWYWILLGLVLLASEVLTPGGFVLLFFGLAAVAVGVIAGLGFSEPTWLQWVLFSGFSIVSLLVFRGPLLTKVKGRSEGESIRDTLVGELAIPLEDLSPKQTGKAELR